MTGLVVAIDARRDPLEVENEFLYYNSQRRHRFGGGRRSHYYNSQSIGNGGTMVEDTNLPTITNPTMFVGATILAFRPSNLHHKRLH